MARGKESKSDSPTSVRLGDDLEKRLEEFCDHHFGVSKTNILRKSVERFLDEEEAKSHGDN